MIKACFFDIDGTLLSHKIHAVPKSTLSSLNAIKKKGIKLALCTGRHEREVENVDFSGLSFDYSITLNGQMVKDYDNNVIAAFPFPENLNEKIKKIFNERNVALMAIEENDLYMNVINDAAVIANASFSIPLPRVSSYRGNPIYQLICYGKKEEVRIVADAIDCDAVWWNELSVDIIPKGGGKDKGIKALINSLGIKDDEIITFGDGENDIGMLKSFPNSVAMGNASDLVKSAASYVTTDIDDNGIENALKHFSLI